MTGPGADNAELAQLVALKEKMARQFDVLTQQMEGCMHELDALIEEVKRDDKAPGGA